MIDREFWESCGLGKLTDQEVADSATAKGHKVTRQRVHQIRKKLGIEFNAEHRANRVRSTHDEWLREHFASRDAQVKSMFYSITGNQSISKTSEALNLGYSSVRSSLERLGIDVCLDRKQIDWNSVVWYVRNERGEIEYRQTSVIADELQTSDSLVSRWKTRLINEGKLPADPKQLPPAARKMKARSIERSAAIASSIDWQKDNKAISRELRVNPKTVTSIRQRLREKGYSVPKMKILK